CAAAGAAGGRVSPDRVSRYQRAQCGGVRQRPQRNWLRRKPERTVEYHWLESPYDRLSALIADLVRRQGAVIATKSTPQVALAAKAATATIPIVFGEGTDPVQLGLVASLARPGGNATGISFLVTEVTTKRLRLLHDTVPKAVHVALLVNPANTNAKT